MSIVEPIDLAAGFPIEDPKILVPWGLSKRELKRLLTPHGVQLVTANYFVVSCTSLHGLSHKLGFHFDRKCRAANYWLELMRDDDSRPKTSFTKFQRHLELTFGPPTQTEPGEDGFPHHLWELGDWGVGHSVYERFGLCEWITIAPKCFWKS